MDLHLTFSLGKPCGSSFSVFFNENSPKIMCNISIHTPYILSHPFSFVSLCLSLDSFLNPPPSRCCSALLIILDFFVVYLPGRIIACRIFFSFLHTALFRPIKVHQKVREFATKLPKFRDLYAYVQTSTPA